MQKTKSKPATSSGDRAYLLTAPEISIFLVCYSMRNSLLELEHSHNEGLAPPEEFFSRFNMILAQFTETAEATYRFDIVLPVMALGMFSPSFWRWFHWWDSYLEGLTHRERVRLERLAMDRLPGIDSYRPPGDWSNCSCLPAFKIIVV
jgi:hypothetical protein